MIASKVMFANNRFDFIRIIPFAQVTLYSKGAMDLTKRQPQTNDKQYLSQEEIEGLSITQEQILDAYHVGTSDESLFYGRASVPSEHTDEDS